MRFADTWRNRLCRVRLYRRRAVVLRTLAHIDCERRLLEPSLRWAERDSLRQRKRFLDEIHGWYAAEAIKIDAMITRLDHLLNPGSNVRGAETSEVFG